MLAEIMHKISGLKAEEQWDDSYRPRPSLAGPERCARQMVYHGLGIPRKPWAGRMVMVLDDSGWHSELSLDWLRQSAFQVHSCEMEVECADPIEKGHIDAIITDILGVDRLLENKSINHFSFQKFWNGEELPLDYLTQCALYLNGLQKINPEIYEGILLMKNKNTSAYLEFLLDYRSDVDTLTVIQKTNSQGETKKIDISTPGIVGFACDKFLKVQAYIDNSTLPKRPYDMDHWRCEYCGWGLTCWDGYVMEFKELKTDEMLAPDVADMVRYYKEVGAHKSEIEKEYEELKDKIKKVMKDQGIREGVAGEYLCKLTLSVVSRLDKELLTQAEIEKAIKTSLQERLTISVPKRKDVKNADI